MSDRDDLEELIAKAVYCVPMEGHSYLYEIEPESPGAAADQIRAKGWRRSTVTPEQVDAAAHKIADLPWEWTAPQLEEEDRDYWRARARDVAHLYGLSVAEDGGQ